MIDNKEKIKFLIEQGYLISPDMLADLDKTDLESLKTTGAAVLNKDLKELSSLQQPDQINWDELEKSRVLFEKNKNTKTYESFLEYLGHKPSMQQSAPLSVNFSYKDLPKKKDVQDFVSYFTARYNAIEKMLRPRQELRNLTSIGRLHAKKDKETVSIIGMVSDKQHTKNGNIMLTIEDPTGSIKALVSKSKPDLLAAAKDIVLDEIIGLVGMSGEEIMFANLVIWPDVPINHEQRKSPEDIYAIFLSDLHVGSKKFLPEEFARFTKWINGATGTPSQREIASKVKYLFLAGDLVDGVGIYPDQESELEIRDIYAQYAECARLLSQIPKNINVICCPGNHDAVRISEPQPAFSEDIAKPLLNLPNVTAVSNPGMVRIAESGGFSGFDVLLYHGYSFDYFIANVDGIRTKGGYDRADLVMKFLLQRRHLAPSHSSTLYIPDPYKDPLVIETVPDFFITGHIHKVAAAVYRSVTTISGSCWQSKTAFQEKLGHHPEPARVPVVNLNTREVKILKFGKNE